MVASRPPVRRRHLHPTAALAPRALLPRDPGRALALAQALTRAPKMFNHSHGLWGYTGIAADGEPLTIQSTGLGGPSAAIVLEELCALGLRRAIALGPGRALRGDVEPGTLVVATAAIASDGTSRALGAGDRVGADQGLVDALRAAAPATARAGPVATSDLADDRDPARTRTWVRAGALAVEMEAAALLRVGELRGVPVACVLAIDAGVDGVELVAERLLADEDVLGRIAAAALADGARAEGEPSGSA